MYQKLYRNKINGCDETCINKPTTEYISINITCSTDIPQFPYAKLRVVKLKKGGQVLTKT